MTAEPLLHLCWRPTAHGLCVSHTEEMINPVLSTDMSSLWLQVVPTIEQKASGCAPKCKIETLSTFSCGALLVDLTVQRPKLRLSFSKTPPLRVVLQL